jgi:hypothetical protein
MNDKRRNDREGERTIPPRDMDRAGRRSAVDDHVVTPYPRGIGHQPTGGLDEGVVTEHLADSSQGVKVEHVPDPDREPPPDDDRTD